MYSKLNTLSEYTYFYVSKTLLHTLLFLVFKIVKNLWCILKQIFSDGTESVHSKIILEIRFTAIASWLMDKKTVYFTRLFKTESLNIISIALLHPFKTSATQPITFTAEKNTCKTFFLMSLLNGTFDLGTQNCVLLTTISIKLK